VLNNNTHTHVLNNNTHTHVLSVSMIYHYSTQVHPRSLIHSLFSPCNILLSYNLQPSTPQANNDQQISHYTPPPQTLFLFYFFYFCSTSLYSTATGQQPVALLYPSTPTPCTACLFYFLLIYFLFFSSSRPNSDEQHLLKAKFICKFYSRDHEKFAVKVNKKINKNKLRKKSLQILQ